MMKSILVSLLLTIIRFTYTEIDRKHGATNTFNLINKGRMYSHTVLMFLEDITLGECANYCILHLDCHTVSYSSSARLCELNNMNFDGVKADKDAVGWVNYGTRTKACYGAKDEDYGEYNVWKSGQLKALRLSHHSGSVSCNYRRGAKWGCNAYGKAGFTVVVTDEKNDIVFPEFFTLDHSHYSLNSTIYDDYISLSLTNPIAVRKGQHFRIWDLQDLKNYTEHNNSGKHCAYVELIYDE